MIRTETQTRELAARMNIGLVRWYERKPDEAIERFESLCAEFEAYGDLLLLAKLHNNLGIAFYLKAEMSGERLYFNRTLEEYAIVKKYLNNLDDLPAIAIVEANIANVLLMLGNIKEAHAHLNIAEEILKDFNDESLLGRALETRARVFLAEGNLEQALIAIDRSECLLMNGVEVEPLAETVRTKSLIYAACWEAKNSITEIL